MDEHLTHLAEDYMEPVIAATAFTSLTRINAFTLLQLSLPLIVPTYRFVFQKEDCTSLLGDAWIQDTVMGISHKKGVHLLTTNRKRKYYCRNLVVATPPQVSKKLLGFKQKLRGSVKVHMFHITGHLIPKWSRGDEKLFGGKCSILVIAPQSNGSFLVYTKKYNPTLEEYFSEYTIIKHKFWNPAFHIEGSNIVDFIQKENVYLIGDNNICSLEDSYISGVYAANKIMGLVVD